MSKPKPIPDDRSNVKPDYTPTISISLAEAVNAWVGGMCWPNGDKISVRDFRWYVSMRGDEITIMPRCEPASDEQLIPKK